MGCVKCIGPEGQGGILKPNVANIAMNSGGCDLLQQWNTQMNISQIIEPKHKLRYVSGINIGFYKKQSLNIQVVQEEGTKADDISKTPTALP